MSVTENDIETALRLGVEARGGECLKFTSPGRRGVPDRMIVMPFKDIVFVETKAPNGALKPWQWRFHSMLRCRGHRVEVLWTIAQVDHFLTTI